MDRISRCSRGTEGVRFGDLRNRSLLFADDVGLFVRRRAVMFSGSSLERFATEYEAAGMRMSTSKSETMVLSQKRVECPLRVVNEILSQVDKFKYLGVLFTREGQMEQEIDRRIGAASAVIQALHRPVVVKKEMNQFTG